MTFRVHIHIVPRKGLLDPQGKAVADALHSLGFAGVRDVRIGRHIVVDVDADTSAAAGEQATAMCERLMANPVTEDFVIEHVEAGEA
jgi:phosphoribosylformylglycinamidine synthase PurS subunit